MNKWILPLILGGVIIMAILMGRKFVEPHIETFAKAIMEFEGWLPNSRAVRNNNPGNLKFAGQTGAYAKDDEGHAIFGSFEEGWNALINQIHLAFNGTSRVYKPSNTLYDFFSKYSQAHSKQYAEFVAAKLGVDPDTMLSQIS